MTLLLRGAVLALLLTACGEAPDSGLAALEDDRADTSDVSPAGGSPYAACESSGAMAVCVDSVERTLIRAAAGSVRRSGDTLWISGTDGSTLSLLSGFPVELPMAFRYGGDLSSLGHGVEVTRYEGSEFLLVDAETTNQTHLIGRPVLAPGGTRFAAASLDLVAGYNANGVQIWNLLEQGPVLAWEVGGGMSWGASDLRWMDDNTLRFTMHRPAPSDPTVTSRTEMRVSIREGGIHLDRVDR